MFQMLSFRIHTNLLLYWHLTVVCFKLVKKKRTVSLFPNHLKDEAIQNGNIYPPSQLHFTSSMKVWEDFGSTRDKCSFSLKTGEWLQM